MNRIILVSLGLILPLALPAVSPTPAPKKNSKSKVPAARAVPSKTAAHASTAVRGKTAAPRATTYRTKRKVHSPWDTPTFADSTWGDVVDGEDLTVRRAAVEALGPYNGTVVVADPNTGRVLAIVNQKLALGGAYQPCSTIKLVAGLAGLSEGIVERDTRLRLSRRESINLTTALAKSNNPYFANIGEKLGFDKVNYYGRLFGLGEKAGLNIEGESPGIFPDEKPKAVPVGMMTSFGEAISLTPMQLTAMVSAIANGGTLYYLQYPRNQEEAQSLVPRVKRQLEFQRQLPDMKPGMMGAVDFGTARRALYDANEPIYGKTGTCTDSRTHLGWFGSYNEAGRNKLVVVVLLTGGRRVNGPVAAGIAGQVYKNLSAQQYFASAQGAYHSTHSSAAGDSTR
ncbi:MAG: penicillin-binding protein [Candidatus Solibacter usitatus]|nr:penicillin-binding protein [Candidatus Solibacter usitatus]